jgi:REP element-mobilizing transposase RayT
VARPPRIPVRLPSGQRVTYFITLCIRNRQRVLDNDLVFAAIKNFCPSSKSWTTECAVVMPDHFHALISPIRREMNPTAFSAALKQDVRETTNASWEWQDGLFDRLLRRNEFAEASGITCVKIRFAPALCNDGKTGHTSSRANCRAVILAANLNMRRGSPPLYSPVSDVRALCARESRYRSSRWFRNR